MLKKCRNKCDCVRLRNRKRSMENIQNVFMRLFQRKSTESTSPPQTSFIDEFADSTSKVLVSVMMMASLSFEVKDFDISRTYLLGTMGEVRTQLHLTRACVEHNAGLRKTNAALCRGKHNGALLCNPYQDVRMAIQGDIECLLNYDGFKHIDIQNQRRSERYGRTHGFKDSNVKNLVTT